MCHLSLFPHPTDRLTRSLCYLKVSKRKKIDGFETKKAFLKEIELQIYFNIQSPPPSPNSPEVKRLEEKFRVLEPPRREIFQLSRCLRSRIAQSKDQSSFAC